MKEKLDKKNVENIIRLTPMQQCMLFHYINDNDSEYHEQLTLSISGDLKIDLMQKALNIIIDNNEMLRAVYRWQELSIPVQIILKKNDVLIKYFDFTNEKYKDNEVEKVKQNDLINKIDIKKETLRIYLCKLEEDKYTIIMSNHHILFDGWSSGIIIRELIDTYNSLYNNTEIKIKTKTSFTEFIKYINAPHIDEEKEYWTSYLKDLGKAASYFSCKEKGTNKEFVYKFTSSKTKEIKDFAKKNSILLSSILYGAWGILLQNISNSNDVVFGTIVSGRTEKINLIENMIGLFINTIPLRVRLEDKVTFLEFIRRLDKEVITRKNYENTSLIDIKSFLKLKSNTEIFNSIVTIENYPLDFNTSNKSVLNINNFSIIEKTNYNMALEIFVLDTIEFRFNFNNLAVEEESVYNYGQYLENIIDTLINNSYIDINEVNLLSELEKKEIEARFENQEVINNFPNSLVDFDF